MSLSRYGLGSQWRRVEDALRDLIPNYDKVNRVISFGLDLRFRLVGVGKAIRGSGGVVLDAGCGPGTMSRLVLSYAGGVKQIILLDPIWEMLVNSRRRLRDGRAEFVQAVFEHLPFREGVFDAVVSAFALRDASDLVSAISELARVVKRFSGRLLVVDLGKPDNKLLQVAMGVYWRIFAPLLASACLGRRGFIYHLLYLTYVKLPANRHLKEIARRFFPYVEFEEKMMGGVVIVAAWK